MSTYFPKEGDITRKWFVVDASGLALGRLASRVARILMGKESPKYTPFIDTGDHVIVINAEKVVLTGKKEDQKIYRHFTGYPGGLVETTVQRVRQHRPQRDAERLGTLVMIGGVVMLALFALEVWSKGAILRFVPSLFAIACMSATSSCTRATAGPHTFSISALARLPSFMTA